MYCISADEGSSSSAEPKRGRSRSAGRPILGVHYTKEEAETVERYCFLRLLFLIEESIFNKDATEAQLKREYRKLALQLHPDKCRAPGATEAFKALGNAYAVLTNKEKRAQYDLYGTEGPRRRSSADGDFYEYDYGRGFEAEFTPEEIFNMFFGGGYPAGHLNRRHRGAQYHFHQHQTGQQEQLMVGDPAFSLHRDRYETLAWRARTFGDAEMWHRAQRIATPSCDRLQQIYS
uniref:J domain-containing protein n=1 Tax=Parascaris equorum TaxID=6256 RepID=A0A914S7Z6_PAREQ